MSWEIKIQTISDYCPYRDIDICCYSPSIGHKCEEGSCPVKIEYVSLNPFFEKCAEEDREADCDNCPYQEECEKGEWI